jgi:hypothetical protein
MPRDCNAIKAVDPVTGKPGWVYVRNAKVKQTAAKGMGAAKELAYTVLDALQKPKAVYRGVKECDDGEEDWLCYVHVPAWAYDHKTGETRKAWKGEVFLVFVDGDLIVRRWGWDEADPNNPYLPIKHDQGRFEERLL